MSNNIVATPPPRSRAASWFIVVPPSREIGPPTDQPGHARHCYHLLSSSLRRAPTHTHTHTHTYTHIPLVAKRGQFLPTSVLFETNAFEVVWNCLKLFEVVWRRLKTFERAIFDFLETVYDFFSFFFERKTLRWERFVASSWEEGRYGCKRKWMWISDQVGRRRECFVYIPWKRSGDYWLFCFDSRRIRVTVSIIRRWIK